MSAVTKKFREIDSLTWLQLATTLFLLGLLFWSSERMRVDMTGVIIGMEVPDQGWVKLKLESDPSPPEATAPVELTLSAEKGGARDLDLGRDVNFRIGVQGSHDALHFGEFVYDPQEGDYIAEVQLPEPGDYWLAVDIGGEKPARFRIDAAPGP